MSGAAMHHAAKKGIPYNAYVLIACLLWLNAQPCLSRTGGHVFYVAVSGSDDNPGSLPLPWRTIRKAADTMAAGDSVYIRNGTYRERVIPKSSGTDADHPIRYVSYRGETATIDGTGLAVPDDAGLFQVEGKKYLVISGLRIIHAGFAGIYVHGSRRITVEKNRTLETVSSGIGIWNSSDIVVDGNDVAKACSGGMQESLSISDVQRFEVKNNHVHHVDNSEKEGICVKDGSSAGKVYGNRVHDITDVGIYADAEKVHTHDIEIFGNIVHDVTCSNGIQLSTEAGGLLEKIKVYNNIVYRNKYYGIAIADAGLKTVRHPIRNVEIVNNTAWGNGIPWGGGISIYNADARDITIRNNICSRNSAFQIALAASVPKQTVRVDHNLVFPFMGYEDEVRGTDCVEADPLLAAPAKGDFRLRTGSPAVDRGSSLMAPALDFAGNARPQDGDGDGIAAIDVGAYERLRKQGGVIPSRRRPSRRPPGSRRT
jgi:parallel beta-helix repeat protein